MPQSRGQHFGSLSSFLLSNDPLGIVTRRSVVETPVCRQQSRVTLTPPSVLRMFRMVPSCRQLSVNCPSRFQPKRFPGKTLQPFVCRPRSVELIPVSWSLREGEIRTRISVSSPRESSTGDPVYARAVSPPTEEVGSRAQGQCRFFCASYLLEPRRIGPREPLRPRLTRTR